MSAAAPSLVRAAIADDLAAIARVHVDTWRATYPGIVPARHLDALEPSASEALWRGSLDRSDGTSLAVAECARAIVGFVAIGPNTDPRWPHAGVLRALYVLPQHQGRGDGTRLFAHAARHWLAAGHRSLIVWVFPQNPACDFYAARGGRRCAERRLDIGGESLLAIGMGWDDIEEITR